MSSLFRTLLVGRILCSVLWFNFHVSSDICMVDIWNILRVWVLFSFFKKYWNLLWQEVNLLDSKLDSIKVYLLALIGEVQSSLYSRFSLALWHGLSGFSFKKAFTLASWNLKDSSLVKTLIIVLYKSLIVVLCLVLWNLMFYTCNFVCGRHNGTSVQILGVFCLFLFCFFLFGALSHKFQLPHFPKLCFLSLCSGRLLPVP